jgi:hypothetical protein
VYQYIAESIAYKNHIKILRNLLETMNRKFIIAGEMNQWAPILFLLFSEQGRTFSKFYNLSNNITKYVDVNNKTLFIFSPMIRTPLSDDKIKLIMESL